ncbi:hypothetical protein [Hymenobacter terrenus]|uniref:hypothetical protein n=1 Tax=Hymenobacter terrenus TaxID=1629124 RepID=UPI000619DA21|nr:hypothetical protein [Hymenobacter terrenus]
MYHRPISLFFASLLLALLLTGCGEAPSTSHQPPATSSLPATPAPRRYTWATAATGPGCLPRLRAMMQWYGTQTENFRQAIFVDGQTVPDAGQDGPPPAPQGPFFVVPEAVDDYLATLRGSGFFSARYVATLRARAKTAAQGLERHQPPKDQLPSLDDFPLFALNYDDMMEQKAAFEFTAEQDGHIVTFDDGFTLMSFTFDTACKIDAIYSKRHVHVNSTRR